MDKTKLLSYSKNFSVYFVASLIPMLLGLFVNPWIALNMSPEDYAISGYYTSFNSLLLPIISFYLIQYFIKEYYKREDEERNYLYALISKGLIYFSGLMAFICFAVLLIYMKIFNNESAMPISPYLAMAVFSLPFTGLLNLELAKSRMKRDAVSFFYASVANGILNIALMVLFVVWMKWGAFGKLLAPLVCNIFVFCWMLTKYKKYLKIRTSFKDFRKILLFCLPLTLSSTLGYFTNGFDRTYLESLGQTDLYGIYIVGSSIGLYLTTFSSTISNTFQADMFETIAKKLWSKYRAIVIIQICLISLIALCFVILAPFVIYLLTAGKYIASTPFAQIISLSTITSSISFIIGSYCIATNRPNLYLYTTILGSALIVVLLPIVVNNYQFYGGAWMSVISFGLFAIINLALLGMSKIKIIK